MSGMDVAGQAAFDYDTWASCSHLSISIGGHAGDIDSNASTQNASFVATLILALEVSGRNLKPDISTLPGEGHFYFAPTQCWRAVDTFELNQYNSAMNLPTSFVTILLSVASLAFGQSETRRYLYISTPDAAQKEGRTTGQGILVFDIDQGHKLVRRINIPAFEEGLRGFAGNLKTHRAYFSTSNRRVGAFDLETEKIVWDKTYEAGADRSAVTLDGKKIYVPTGYWYSGADSGILVLNADNGELIKRINVGPAAHNSIVSLNGRFLYVGTQTMVTLFDTRDEHMIRQIKDVGERGIFPYTMDSRNRIAYVCLGNNVGFDVVNLQTGKALHRVYAGKERIPHRTHGAGLTPDEKELWISDQVGKKLFIYDATKMPPQPKGEVELSQGGHGWVSFSLDGRYAWSHTPDVFDAKTKQLVATLKDENGTPVSGSKFFEVHFRNGKVVEMGNEFALGRK